MEPSRAVVARLADVLAGEVPMSDGEDLFAPDVDIYLDGLHFKGIGTWKTWLRFVRSRSRVADLTLVEPRVTTEGDRIRLSGRWQGLVDGRVETSAVGSATYRVADGRIVEIRSTRTNYVFMLGGLVASYPGLLAVLAYVFFWSTFYQGSVDWEARLPVRQPAPRALAA
jgi:hypothetical protein